MKSKLILIITSLAFAHLSMQAAPIPITSNNPRFTYFTPVDKEDSKAELKNLFFSSEYKCYINKGTLGSISYTFEVGARRE